MKVKIQFKNLKFFFTNKTNKVELNSSQIQQILRKPSQLNNLSALQPQQEKNIQTQKKTKKKPEMIFDLNKTLLDDMLELYKETNDIEQVNKKFEVNIKSFKYGLPIPNIDPKIKGLQDLKEEIDETPPTPLQNLYTKLEITSDSSWNDYCNKLQSTYNFSELLGQKNNKNHDEMIKFIQDDIIPYENLINEKHMDQIREYRSINFDLPGVVETEDPNRFLDKLRPIEDFKHTPQSPISKTRIRQFQEQQKKRKEKKFEIVYSIDKFFTVLLFTASGLTLLYLLRTLQRADERKTEEYFRNKLQKL